MIPHDPQTLHPPTLQNNLEPARSPFRPSPGSLAAQPAKSSPPKSPNKNELRTRETRELLLRAAESVFVRDGYERAELGEIATLAGRTKGAIYAQFKSKEDLFLALFAEHTPRIAQTVQTKLEAEHTPEQRLRVLRDFYVESLGNKNWYMLLLEFKLFGLRHPESKERFQQVLRTLHPRYREEEMAKVFGSEGNHPDRLDRAASIAILSPILSAVAIEEQFTEVLLDPQVQRNIATRLFNALFTLPAE